MSTFFKLLLVNLPVDKEDLATDLLFELGSTGTSQDLSFRQMGEFYEGEIVNQTKINLVGYFNDPVSDEDILFLKNKLDHNEIEQSEEANKDWMAEWKKHFKSFQLAGGYWVVPSWLEAPAEAKTVLKIDPGMAFGTGTHATTQLASEIISERSRLWPKGYTAIDVGTGTGILALLMAHEGASVVGTEIDPVARDVARENVKINNLQNKITILDEQIEDIKNMHDVVVANIIDGVLVRIQEPLYYSLKPGGEMIVTGILDERKDHFLSKFGDNLLLKKIEERKKDDWWGFVFKRL